MTLEQMILKARQKAGWTPEEIAANMKPLGRPSPSNEEDQMGNPIPCDNRPTRAMLAASRAQAESDWGL